MHQPRFSIVIPTCDRHETLHYTIQTALAQDFDDYEIIVSDNFSLPLTQAAVEAFQSPKVRYVRTPKRLAMTNNFEFAVSQAQGDYVIVIGDDDGLMPDALSSIDAIARATGEKAIRWESTHYYWPNMIHEQRRNIASFAESDQQLRFDGEVTIDNVVNYELQYSFLPMLYHAAIHRDIIAELKSRTGTIFKSRSPDIYSGFAIAYLIKHYLYCGHPYSIMGISGKSNGWAYMMNDKAMIQEYENSNQGDKIACHPSVPEIPGLLTATVDSFHCAKDALFPERETLGYDEKSFIITALADNYRPDDDAKNIADLRKSLAKRPELLAWLNKVAVPNLATIKAETPKTPPLSCITRLTCALNVLQSQGIQDIFALTQNYRRIVAEHKNPVESK